MGSWRIIGRSGRSSDYRGFDQDRGGEYGIRRDYRVLGSRQGQNRSGFHGGQFQGRLMVLAAGMGDRAGIRSERGVTKARFVIRPILIASAEMARPSDYELKFVISSL